VVPGVGVGHSGDAGGQTFLCEPFSGLPWGRAGEAARALIYFLPVEFIDGELSLPDDGSQFSEGGLLLSVRVLAVGEAGHCVEDCLVQYN
jgi:hypothetical protein